jgi:hypothetical protein
MSALCSSGHSASRLPSFYPAKVRPTSQTKGEGMNEPINSERNASELARMLRGRFYEDALRRIFSANQLKQISKWSKERGIDRRRVVVEIVKAGIEAKGRQSKH